MCRWSLAVAALAVLTTPAGQADDGAEFRVAAAPAKTYDEVMADLEIAITDRNYRITGRNAIGEALSDRGPLAFPRATVVHFCNLERARAFLQAATEYLLHMPCRAAVYEDGGAVHIGVRLLPENDPRVGALARAVNAELKAIAGEAAR